MQNDFLKSERKFETPSSKKSNGVWETIKFAIIAFAIVWPIRAFVAQPFIVSGSSMVPTFENSQYLIVDQISYRFNEPQRGDVIIFRYPNDTSKFFIKRVIGLPGEKVSIQESSISIETISGETVELSEPYVTNKGNNNMTVEIGSDEYFVMGDNRAASSDSRYWGNLDKSFIVGKAFLRLVPFNSFGVKPGQFDYNF